MIYVIKDFYPFITEQLLKLLKKFAKRQTSTKSSNFEKIFLTLLNHYYSTKIITYNDKNISLFRGDGLPIFKNRWTASTENKKHFQETLKNKGFSSIVEFNLKIINYLAVTLNLNDTYTQYSKENKETNFIHAESDHSLHNKRVTPIR